MRHPCTNFAVATAWWLCHVAVALKIRHYVRSAQRDERQGFQFTAAVEWREAAELLSGNVTAADHAWLQWERIMRMPRRLASPLTTA